MEQSRDLGDGEHEHEVEEQLDEGDALGLRCLSRAAGSCPAWPKRYGTTWPGSLTVGSARTREEAWSRSQDGWQW